jgi:RNA 3'-terminal phosphate cyclase (ATP)
MKNLTEIDGSFGEGGGQVLRTSLALSLVTGKPFRIENIRSGRKKVGLLRQHLTAVNAAAEVGRAVVEGAEIGSTALTFKPKGVKAGEYHFSVGTAGSATLVFQTVLPALMVGVGRSRIIFEGGTHNPYAPPFDFLEKSFLSCLRKMGPKVDCVLERPGFYPAGGGRFIVNIEPATVLSPLNLNERGEILRRKATALLSEIPENVGHRELNVIREMMGWDESCLELKVLRGSNGPGNVLLMELACANVTEVIAGFGERGVAAESVAESAVKELRRYVAAGVPVGKYLADQLLIPIALAGGGSFRTLVPTRHTLTNIEVIKKFLDIEINCDSKGHDDCEIRIVK